MSYNGSGTFLINTAGQPVVSGTVISSTAFNALTADLATGLSTAITKDGQTTVTANIPMGTYKFTGLGAGTAATDSANLSQVQSTVTKLLASVSGADTITAVGSPTLGAYAAGQMFYFVAASANTGAVTINIDSLGAKSITRDGTTALAAGDIQSGEVCVIVYDGTQFQLVNGASQSASIVTENLTVNKATVLNESGGDNDTRIEGGTDANLFFVDASTDRIGIGTSSPSYPLHVRKDSGAYEIIGIQNNTSAALLRAVGNGGGSADFGAAEIVASAAVIRTASVERLRIDASGNLGLGVTPSAWGSNYKAFESAGNAAAVVAGANVNGVAIVANAYQDNTNWLYKTTGTAAYYSVGTGTGIHAWFTAPSGTAGNTISFTQAMTLDASGNLLVGTTSSLYATAGRGVLEVNGSSSSLIACKVNNAAAGYLFHSGTDLLLVNSISGALRFDTNNTERARITAGGEVYIAGTTDQGAYNLQVNGTGVWGAGAYVNGSDERLKDNIQSLDSGLDVVKAMRAVTFQYKPEHSKDQSVQPGFIAQELQEAMAGKPYLEGVVQSGPEYLNVAYQNIIPILVKAIQELEAKVAALEAA